MRREPQARPTARHGQRPARQARVGRLAHRPPDDTPRVRVDHRRQVQPALGGRDERDVANPLRVRPRGRELAAAAARPGESVEVWSEDEARSGQQGTLTTAYADVHALTAVCPAAGAAEGLVAPRLDTGVVQSFLDRLSAAPGVHAVLVWGGAGYHSASRSLRCPADMTLVTLPPYPPELNPVDRQWLDLRRHHWSSRVPADAGAVERAAAEGRRAACLNPERVETVCRREYLTAGSYTLRGRE